VRRLDVDLNDGEVLEDGRGITRLIVRERRNKTVPKDLYDGEPVLLADHDEFPDGSPAWIEIPATVIAVDSGWAAVWNWDDRAWVPRELT
jgi:hypothetical protein